MPPTEAGKGEHHVYRIVPASADQTKLTAGKHYIALDAVAWFINKQGNWFTDRMSSGTLDLKLASGLEKYQTALGTFDLKGGSRVAPVFDRPVLPDRNFRGGSITLAASLTAIKKDTVIAGMLKSAASASIGIVAGMVQTATIAGPATLLSAAGEDLIGGVKKLLTDTAEKREPLFDFSGLEYTLQPDDVIGPQIFLLFHRGANLPEKQLTVQTQGQLLLPFINNSMVDDGAWLLLRIRRSSDYSGIREWFDTARAFRGKLSSLVDYVDSGAISKEEALKRLKPSSTGDSTLFDEYGKLRTIIFNDGVLSELEAGLYVGQLKAVLVAAQKAISGNNSAVFTQSLTNLKQSLLKGEDTAGQIGKVFKEEVIALAETRRSSMPKRRGVQAAEVVSADSVFADMRQLPKTVKNRMKL